MRTLNFKLEDGHSCVEFLYRAIAHYYDIDYELMFLESWSFDYNQRQSFCPNSNESSIKSNLLKYHGLKTIKVKFSNVDDTVSYIDNILGNNEFCMLNVDLYWIPWNVSCFNKRHWNHVVLITKKENNDYFCYDNFSLNGNFLPANLLQGDELSITTFTLDTPSIMIHNHKECCNILRDCIERKLVCQSAFIKMEQFANLFDDSFDIYEMTKDNIVFENSAFIGSINRIAQCRFQFACVLKYLSTKFNDIVFHCFSEELKKCAVSWKSITSLLIKLYLLDNDKRLVEKVHEKILVVKTHEEQICSSLYHYLTTLETNHLVPQMREKENGYLIYRYVNLRSFFNHKAFGDSNNTQHAKYEDNCFLILNDAIIGRTELISNDLRFKIIDVAAGEYDNIVCMAQTIEVNAKCSSIMIMSNAEYDHQIDVLTLVTDDEMINIEVMSTSCHSTPVLNDAVIWQGQAGLDEDGNVLIHPGKIRIFGKRYNIGREVQLKSIKLPYNPNLHIFAITLCTHHTFLT